MIHFCEVIEIKEFIKQTFLFNNIDDAELEKLTRTLDYRVTEYSRGDVIYSPDSFCREVGFVLNGECEVLQHTSEGGKVILNTLGAGDSFGILAVFGEGDFPTEVQAKKKCRVLFLTGDAICSLVERSGSVAMNVIRFLTRRVNFLNQRLEATTLGSVDKKLASYLISQSEAEGSSVITLNYKRCSEIICAGRASVYRAIENLKTKGYIMAENKIITILDKDKMEDFIK